MAMFKAKIMEDADYYQLRRKHLLILLLPVLPAGILYNIYDLPSWLIIATVVVYVIIIAFGIRNQKSMSSLLGHRMLEIDADEIRIKTKNGKAVESFSPKSLARISVQDKYTIPHESMSGMTKEVKGKPIVNYISILSDQDERRFDFELDSHYMISQLEKVISGWKNQGFHVVTDERQLA